MIRDTSQLCRPSKTFLLSFSFPGCLPCCRGVKEKVKDKRDSLLAKRQSANKESDARESRGDHVAALFAEVQGTTARQEQQVQQMDEFSGKVQKETKHIESATRTMVGLGATKAKK